MQLNFFNENIFLEKKRTPRIPYQGGKNKIANEIIEAIINNTENTESRRFVDAFAGGGSISYGVLQTKKFKEILANDINEKMIFLHKNIKNINLFEILANPCVFGGSEIYEGTTHINNIKNDLTESVSRVVYSFGNDLSSNMFSKNLKVKYLLGKYLVEENNKVGVLMSNL